MASFSQRYGFKSIRQALQIDNIDKPLRTSLWNTHYIYFEIAIHKSGVNQTVISQHIWTEFLKKDIKEYSTHNYDSEVHSWFRTYASWYQLYEFMEFCCDILDFKTDLQNLKEPYIEENNRILEREMSAYRFVGILLTRITSEVEIEAIEQATQSSADRWLPVTKHLRTALGMFSDRQTPDYRNSVKESISAIESACKIITGDDKATLGTALKVLEAKGSIHPSLKAGFDKLYGYTSDQGGIRHAMLDSSNPVTFDEAKFMLVACSAFSNYLQPHLP